MTVEDPRIRRACVDTLFRQAPNSFAAAMVVTVYMSVTAWPYTARPVLLAWLAVQLSTQLVRGALVFPYRRRRQSADPAPWNRAYAAYMALAGLVWGSCAFLFVHAEAPISLALTLCGLYGISSGSIPGNAYNPAAVYLFVGAIFAAVLARMVAIGDLPHVALGIASLCFALIMVLFTRVQHRTIVENFRVRFENADLLEQLRVEKGKAEAEREKAEQANLAKSRFLAAASHDLRQPLYALSLFSSTLEALRLDAKARAIVGKIHASIGALESLFNALLDISKLEAGAVRPELEAVSVAEIFERLRTYVQAEAERGAVSLRLRSANGFVLADAALLERVLGNLVSNALRYAREGKVVVGCRIEGTERVRFEVWDNGIGIAAADRDRIFDDFVQLANPERDRRKGLGLGLAIARRTALLLDSDIAVRSWPGCGSVFSLSLPRAPAPAQMSPSPEPSGDPLTGLRLLFIDDEQSIREGLTALVSGWGVRVRTVADEQSALHVVAEQGPFDVAIADYRLQNGRTGIEALAAIASAQSPPPACCLVTGDIDPGLIAAARERDLPLLHKPVRPARLRALLQSLAARTPSDSPASTSMAPT